MDLTGYKHIPDCLKPNKNKIPKNIFYFDRVDEFNAIYMYAKDNFKLVSSTQSKGISVKKSVRFFQRYMINITNQCFELVIICSQGCYRFILKNQPGKDNTVQGSKAVREIYELAKKHNKIDDLRNISIKDGEKVKTEINAPHIQFLVNERFLGKALDNCYHIDFNSAYASKIIKQYPQLTSIYNEMYSKRKDDNGYYKHVLTNSIGCFQSKYCPDIFSTNYHKTAPYQFANLAKIAINETRNTIEEYIEKIKQFGATPLLTNTDGIWYYSDIGAYHDELEGTNLGEWKHDAYDVKLLIKSKGAYQYLTKEGKCKSVVRGKTNLDLILDRDDWKFGDIMTHEITVEKWKFNYDKGVEKVWLKM